MVTWQKDRQEQHEDVEIGETLPNSDGTFQKSVQLTVKPEEWKNHKYQCVVQISGIQEDFIKDLTEDKIQTNRRKNARDVNYHKHTGLFIGVGVALLLVTAAFIWVVIWKKKSMESEQKNVLINVLRDEDPVEFLEDRGDVLSGLGVASDVAFNNSSLEALGRAENNRENAH
ncbi:hypothetical protein DPEC_G00201530 [Dallia pectoralis]|uniref:Uncharacterized protein n=1 Tax=Dallia pectoralis TaxID=75939 RepID=A0ACC2G8N2_DALPE|nr:hypothetical protein DPEC_G00201530 [Dallia pectoralis]